jgi:hypothetical protein
MAQLGVESGKPAGCGDSGTQQAVLRCVDGEVVVADLDGDRQPEAAAQLVIFADAPAQDR